MAAVALLAPVGCSTGGEDEPQPASGAPKAIAATVERLERAVARQDYAELCGELFTERARRRAGGAECEAQVRSAAEGVRSPTIEIQGIDVTGDRARVKVSTKAEGQQRVTDTLDLRREGDRWLVEALG